MSRLCATPGCDYPAVPYSTPAACTPHLSLDDILEAKLEELFRDLVRVRLAGMCIKMSPTIKGVPDRLVLLPGGRTYLVELKRAGGGLSPAQRKFASDARALGHHVETLYGVFGIRAWVAARAAEASPRATAPRLQSTDLTSVLRD